MHGGPSSMHIYNMRAHTHTLTYWFMNSYGWIMNVHTNEKLLSLLKACDELFVAVCNCVVGLGRNR